MVNGISSGLNLVCDAIQSNPIKKPINRLILQELDKGLPGHP